MSYWHLQGVMTRLYNRVKVSSPFLQHPNFLLFFVDFANVGRGHIVLWVFVLPWCNQMPSPSLTQIDLSDGFFMSSTIKVMSPKVYDPFSRWNGFSCNLCARKNTFVLWEVLSIKADHDLALLMLLCCGVLGPKFQGVSCYHHYPFLLPLTDILVSTTLKQKSHPLWDEITEQ